MNENQHRAVAAIADLLGLLEIFAEWRHEDEIELASLTERQELLASQIESLNRSRARLASDRSAVMRAMFRISEGQPIAQARRELAQALRASDPHSSSTTAP